MMGSRFLHDGQEVPHVAPGQDNDNDRVGMVVCEEQKVRCC